jgi:hypothetical protein
MYKDVFILMVYFSAIYGKLGILYKHIWNNNCAVPMVMMINCVDLLMNGTDLFLNRS